MRMRAKAIGVLLSLLSLGEAAAAEASDKEALPKGATPTIVVQCYAPQEGVGYCPTYAVGHVKLLRQFSKQRCRQYDSWGADGDGSGIWVAKGCRGRFMVERGRPFATGKSTAVTCTSEDWAYRHCATPTWGHRIVVGKQLGDSACTRGTNWGFDWNGIWVNGNCAAEFRVE
jgi:hypothetical protein